MLQHLLPNQPPTTQTHTLSLHCCHCINRMQNTFGLIMEFIIPLITPLLPSPEVEKYN